jgi:hypothetical protein
MNTPQSEPGGRAEHKVGVGVLVASIALSLGAGALASHFFWTTSSDEDDDPYPAKYILVFGDGDQGRVKVTDKQRFLNALGTPRWQKGLAINYKDSSGNTIDEPHDNITPSPSATPAVRSRI